MCVANCSASSGSAAESPHIRHVMSCSNLVKAEHGTCRLCGGRHPAPPHKPCVNLQCVREAAVMAATLDPLFLHFGLIELERLSGAISHGCLVAQRIARRIRPHFWEFAAASSVGRCRPLVQWRVAALQLGLNSVQGWSGAMTCAPLLSGNRTCEPLSQCVSTTAPLLSLAAAWGFRCSSLWSDASPQGRPHPRLRDELRRRSTHCFAGRSCCFAPAHIGGSPR